MKWYIIIFLVIGYMAVALITALIYREEVSHDDMAALFGMFWPITLPIAIIILPFYLLEKILEWL